MWNIALQFYHINKPSINCVITINKELIYMIKTLLNWS